MSRHASRKPKRKFKIPQHERIARNKRRFQAQQLARRLEKEEMARLERQMKEAQA
jgi:hypothetical protein